MLTAKLCLGPYFFIKYFSKNLKKIEIVTVVCLLCKICPVLPVQYDSHIMGGNGQTNLYLKNTVFYQKDTIFFLQEINTVFHS